MNLSVYLKMYRLMKCLVNLAPGMADTIGISIIDRYFDPQYQVSVSVSLISSQWY